jgi:hypothetical protein
MTERESADQPEVVRGAGPLYPAGAEAEAAAEEDVVIPGKGHPTPGPSTPTGEAQAATNRENESPV